MLPFVLPWNRYVELWSGCWCDSCMYANVLMGVKFIYVVFRSQYAIKRCRVVVL